ncbi:MAG: photosynthetic reaction center cytochrome c subunit family protein [Gemmatimonadales bacterium]
MHRAFRLAVPCLLIAGTSCAKSATTPAPAPSPVPVAAPAPSAAAGAGGAQVAGQQAQANAGGRGGAPGGPPRPQLTPEQRAVRRDSLTALRAATLDLLKKQIAGHDSEPAGKVFKNIQINKDAPAIGLLNSMEIFGRALSVNCTTCHVPDKWDDDTKGAKKTARIMIQLVAAINTEQLSKLPPNRNGQTPRIGCTTCHRGNQQPGNALLP